VSLEQTCWHRLRGELGCALIGSHLPRE
jgi:hypothetical protein